MQTTRFLLHVDGYWLVLFVISFHQYRVHDGDILCKNVYGLVGFKSPVGLNPGLAKVDVGHLFRAVRTDQFKNVFVYSRIRVFALEANPGLTGSFLDVYSIAL